MRVRHYPMTSEMLEAFFVTGAEHAFRVASGLPLDARIREVFTEADSERGGLRIVMVVESREFEDIRAFGKPPERGILMEDRTEFLGARPLFASAAKPPN